MKGGDENENQNEDDESCWGREMMGVCYRSAARLPNRPFFQRKRNQSRRQYSSARETEKRVVELHVEIKQIEYLVTFDPNWILNII